MAVTKGDDGSPDRLQGTLFDDSEVPGVPERSAASGQPGAESAETMESGELGYRGPTACSAAGITYRQLDYWARTALVEPSVRAEDGLVLEPGGAGFQDDLAKRRLRRTS